VRDRLDEFGADTEVVLVTFTDPAQLVSYRAKTGLPFPILVDADRSVYRAYGLGRASTRRVWSLGVLRTYARLLRRDGVGSLERPTDDTRQLGGDMVVAPDGTLAWGFWSDGPDDRPTIDTLISASQLGSDPS